MDEYFADDGSLVNSENSIVESQEINKTATIDNSDSSSENSSSEELNYEVPYTIVGDYVSIHLEKIFYFNLYFCNWHYPQNCFESKTFGWPLWAELSVYSF